MGHDAIYADVRIAVVDDNRNFQNLLRTLLRSMGFRRVDVFADPFEARAFVTDTPVDIAFVDLIMPRQSGIDWTRSIRRSSLLANPTMPIALLTGLTERRVIAAAVKAGVDDILAKPLSPATLYRHTMRLLRHPTAYVRGRDGYFGPNLCGAHDAPARAGAGERGGAGGRRDDDRRGARRSVPGLHVEIRRQTSYDSEQAFLD